MSEKKQRMTTPVGSAKWAHIATPKPAFKEKDGSTKGKPKYCVDVVFDPKDPAWKTWADDMRDKLNALPVQINKKTGEKMPKQSPIKRELDKEDNPTGMLVASFATSEQYRPQVFDAWGKHMPEDTKIGNGSKVRVSYNENVYEGFGGGYNFYLSAIQVIELVAFQSQSATDYGFTVDESTPPAEDNADESPF